jgi:hypothetical protein
MLCIITTILKKLLQKFGLFYKLVYICRRKGEDSTRFTTLKTTNITDYERANN